MSDKLNLGGGVIGLLFLALGVLKFVRGDDWIVWIFLATLLLLVVAHVQQCRLELSFEVAY